MTEEAWTASGMSEPSSSPWGIYKNDVDLFVMTNFQEQLGKKRKWTIDVMYIVFAAECQQFAVAPFPVVYHGRY